MHVFDSCVDALLSVSLGDHLTLCITVLEQVLNLYFTSKDRKFIRQSGKPWNFLHSTDLPAQTLNFITDIGLKVFASYIKTLCSMNMFVRFSAIYLLLHTHYR